MVDIRLLVSPLWPSTTKSSQGQQPQPQLTSSSREAQDTLQRARASLAHLSLLLKATPTEPHSKRDGMVLLIRLTAVCDCLSAIKPPGC